MNMKCKENEDSDGAALGEVWVIEFVESSIVMLKPGHQEDMGWNSHEAKQ